MGVTYACDTSVLPFFLFFAKLKNWQRNSMSCPAPLAACFLPSSRSTQGAWLRSHTRSPWLCYAWQCCYRALLFWPGVSVPSHAVSLRSRNDKIEIANYSC